MPNVLLPGILADGAQVTDIEEAVKVWSEGSDLVAMGCR